MRILSFDPGLNNTGWSIIEHNNLLDSGTICPPKSFCLKEKLIFISESIIQINWILCDEVAIEDSYVNVNPSTSLSLAVVRGMIVNQCVVHKKDFFFYTPSEVKQNVGATGAGSKPMVKLFVGAILQQNLDNLSEHIIDSIAVGLCHINRIGLN